MSADANGAIGPVSVRYAAQIRELLYAQAMQRMVADQEAARASEAAERAARTEPKTKDPELNAKVDPLPATTRPEPVKAPPAKPVTDTAKPDHVAPGQLVDIQA
ncbi:MAG: hypothetical protein EON61_14000 [Alphaproteobacteria bacterium]|jgi:hypothetical protein|nr:MAG: hypothetical protein EON61_14000 [Alphaproteobacteria bacterium]